MRMINPTLRGRDDVVMKGVRNGMMKKLRRIERRNEKKFSRN